MSKPTSGHTAVITGAAGGLGKEMALRLAREGHRLILTDLEDCAAVAAAVGEAVLLHRRCDLSSADEVDAFIAAAGEVAAVDILVNNAAMLFMKPFEEVTHRDIAAFNRINVEASFQLIGGFAPGMRARGWGRILNLTTAMAWAPQVGGVPYVTSKMGVVGLTRSCARELGRYGITVNCISPSFTMHHNNSASMPPEMIESVWARQSIPRRPTPDDLMGAVAFLVSEDAGFMSGQSVMVDGGKVML